MLNVQDDVVISMDYTLRLVDGEVIDSSEGRGPLQFIQGKGEIIPGLESQLYGLAIGDERDIMVAPADGYGEFDADLFETLPHSVFPPDIELEPGMGFRMRTETGEVVVAYVDTVEDDQVVVNLNHPLAGQTLYFNIKIADLRTATPEELAEGLADEGCGCGCESCDHGCCDEDEE